MEVNDSKKNGSPEGEPIVEGVATPNVVVTQSKVGSEPAIGGRDGPPGISKPGLGGMEGRKPRMKPGPFAILVGIAFLGFFLTTGSLLSGALGAAATANVINLLEQRLTQSP